MAIVVQFRLLWRNFVKTLMFVALPNRDGHVMTCKHLSILELLFAPVEKMNCTMKSLKIHNRMRTSPFRKQYIIAIKNPWNDVRKCVIYDHIANTRAERSNGASVMLSKFVIPNNGNRTTAALTAFLTCSISDVWLWRNLTTRTLMIFSRNMKFNCNYEGMFFIELFILKQYLRLTKITVNLGPSRIQ